MASLDEIVSNVWNTPRPPLSILAAAGCARAAAAPLSAEDRAPFEAFTRAALAWYPDKKRSLGDLFQNELSACLNHYGEHEDHVRLQPSLDAAYHLMMALRVLSPGAIALHELGIQDAPDEHTLAKLVRQLAKASGTDLETWKSRLEHVLSFRERSGKDAAWPTLVHDAARIGFDRPMRGTKQLPKPLPELAKLADLGATASWSAMGPRHALTLQLGTTKRIAVLDDAQRAALLEALPWLA